MMLKSVAALLLLGANNALAAPPKGKVDLSNDAFAVIATGNQNVPQYTFYRKPAPETTEETAPIKYKVKFQKMYEQLTDGRKVNQVSLPSQSWEFLMDQNDPEVFWINGTSLGLFFKNKLNADSFKFDVDITDYTFESDDADASLVLEWQLLKQEGGDDEEEEEEEGTGRFLQTTEPPTEVAPNQICFFGDSPEEVCFIVALNAEASSGAVTVTVDYEGSGFVKVMYSKFQGDLSHDPEVKVTPVKKGCFPGSSVVEEQTRGLIPMNELNIGDSVRAGNSQFSEVYGFHHHESNVQGKFLQIGFENSEQQALELTPEHMVFVNGAGALPAAKVKTGDKLGESVVQFVKEVKRKGYFAPVTYSGDIVVNGVLVSAYSSVVTNSPVSEHFAGHVMLAYHRLMCRFEFSICENETYTVRGHSKLAKPVMAIADLLSQFSGPMVVVLAAPVVPLVAFFFVLEQIVVSPFLLCALCSGLYWFAATKNKKSKAKAL